MPNKKNREGNAMSNEISPDFDLYDWGELEAHRSFVARYDFRNESRWNGDGERYVSVIAHTYVENCSSAER
jgi:hypothetical protein